MPTRIHKRIIKTPRHEIAVQLRQLAHERGPGAKLPTTRELSTLFGTSLPTLNAVLDELESASVISRKDRSGLYVSPRLLCKNIVILMDTRMIATPGITPFWCLLLAFCFGEAQKRSVDLNETYSYQIIAPSIGSCDPFPEHIINDVLTRKTHGIIVICLESANPALFDPLFPIVAFGGYSHWSVSPDEVMLVRLGVRSLFNQGCRRIEMWRPTNFGHDYTEPPSSLTHGPNRLQENEFKSELAACGLNPDDHPIRDFRAESLVGPAISNQDQGAMIARQVFSVPPDDRPDGILILDDMMTSGSIYMLQKLGVRLGVDVKFATHANAGSTVLYGYANDLTLIEVDPAAIASALFEVLDDLMSGRTPPCKERLMAPRISPKYACPPEL